MAGPRGTLSFCSTLYRPLFQGCTSKNERDSAVSTVINLKRYRFHEAEEVFSLSNGSQSFLEADKKGSAQKRRSVSAFVTLGHE